MTQEVKGESILPENDLVQDNFGESILEKKNQDYTGPKTTLFYDPNSGKRYPILGKYSPNIIADNILNYLDSAGFANVLNIGMSGSGKSTWSNQLIHLLHTKRSFHVNWYKRDQVKDFTKIINSLTKGINHIVIFDDASFALEEMKKDDLSDMAKKLTYIRHIVQANVIVVFNIHYSKAIKKFFRVAPFKFLTSIENEEVQSFQDLFGSYSRYKLSDYARYFKHQMLNKGWKVQLDEWDNKFLDFTTDKPFRFGLANEITDLHYFVYLKDSCEKCVDPEDKEKTVANSEQLINHLVKKYGKRKVSAVLKYYGFTQHGIKSLDSDRTVLWHTISKLDKSNHYDWKDVIDNVQLLLNKKRTRAYVKHPELNANVNEINELNNTLVKDINEQIDSIDETDL